MGNLGQELNGYNDLYAAIWEQAVIDDMKRVVKHLSAIGIDRAHKSYCKLAGENVPKEDPRFKKINEDIKAYCKVKARAIDQRTRELIYQEAQDWPKNKRLWVSDTEYQEILKELEVDIKDFAVKRMGTHWRRLTDADK